MPPNGPAIWGGCVTRRSIRAVPIAIGTWYPTPAGPENCHDARRVWRTFCRHGTNFIECWRDRGTSLIGAANLSPITKLVAGTGAVSRYKLSRSQKFIMVQNFNCVQMRALTAVASAKAGVQVLQPLQICLECRSKSKKCDKQFTHIVRVSRRQLFSVIQSNYK